MITISDMEDFLNMLYPDSNIPSYIYKKENLVASIPPQTGDTLPPRQYLEPLLRSGKHISYILTDYGTAYGCVRPGDHPEWCYVFGPVSSYLCYSSQSHFQTAVKRTFAIRFATCS